MNEKWHLLSTAFNHSDIVEDFQGGYWISTIDNGLIYVPSLKITTILGNLPEQYFRDIIPSPKGYFVSTSKGKVLEINKKGEIIQTFDTKTGWEIEFMYFDKTQNRLYTSVGHFNYPNPDDFTSFYYGKGLAQDEFGNIFYGIHSYSAVIQSSENISVRLPSQRIENISSIALSVIRETRTRDVAYGNQTLYVAQMDKLLLYSENGETELKDKNGNAIHAVKLTVDDDGNLWAATNLQGVFCFRKDKLIKHITEENGLASNYCKGISHFRSKIFVIAPNGVTSIDRDDFTTVELNSRYGINNLTVNDVLGDENALLFVTKNGIISLESNENDKPALAKLQFEGIKNEAGQGIQDIQKIPYSNNTVEISWSLLDYRFGKNNSVYYRVIGFDNQWKSLSSTVNSVIYNNLPAGKYTFQISTDKDFSTFYSIDFSIQKPFWASWWFRILVIAASAFIIWITVKITQRYTQKKQRLKTALIGSQLTALRSQMNPHFLYNVLNSLQGLVYSNKANEAGTYVSMFSDHLRHTLDISGKQWVTVKEETESLEVYLELEKLRFGDDFHYEIRKQKDVSDYLKIPSMIVQPFVENAVKHGLLNKKGDKKVSVCFDLVEDNRLQISVTDNGIGREQSYLINKQRKDKPKSFATQAIENRIDLLNQQYHNAVSLEIIDLKEKGIAVGTAVYLRIRD